jgi:GNAT superfamily N-acetyltransferase
MGYELRIENCDDKLITMNIRKATIEDEPIIEKLLDQLDYSDTKPFLKQKIEIIDQNPNSGLFVYELNENVVAFICVDFTPQLALKGDFARISYLSVDSSVRSKGIGKQLEEFCMSLAKERGCNRIELHCHERRKDAHRFYYRQGYVESPKYLMKML